MALPLAIPWAINFAARRTHDRGQRWGGACRVEKRSVSRSSALICSALCLNVTTFSSEVSLRLVRCGSFVVLICLRS
jgi:hypothetical protein